MTLLKYNRFSIDFGDRQHLALFFVYKALRMVLEGRFNRQQMSYFQYIVFSFYSVLKWMEKLLFLLVLTYGCYGEPQGE